jgi:hypothetical protein
MEESELREILNENGFSDLEGVEVKDADTYLSAVGDYVVVSDREYVSEIRQALSDAGYDSNKALEIGDEWGRYVISIEE